MMAEKRTAYSLVELLIVVMFLGIAVVIAVPRLNFSLISGYKAHTTAEKIATDLRRTRRLAISNAATNTEGFRLKMEHNVSYDYYNIKNDDTKEIVDTITIDKDVSVSCAHERRFKFGPLGNLKDESGTELTVSAEGKTFTIIIIPATGMIKCTEN